MSSDDTATPPRLRVFAETVDAARLRQPEVLHALRERGLQLVLAVRDEDPRAVVEAALEAGVSVALWPMLDDARGRWASTANAAEMSTFARARLDDLARHGALPDELCLDLEPPLPQMRRALDTGVALGRVTGDHDQATRELCALVDHAAQLGVATWAAVVPLVLADRPGVPSWQRLLGTPVDALPLQRVCVMLYTSLLTGYSRGALRRRDAEFLLGRAAARTRDRFGTRASIALGATGRGALGDESTYRDIDELRTDVAITRAAGIDDIALFELGGVLARPHWQTWLDALVQTDAPCPAPRPSRRARLIWWTSGAVSRAAGFRRW
jgi:hypothetical protein